MTNWNAPLSTAHPAYPRLGDAALAAELREPVQPEFRSELDAILDKLSGLGAAVRQGVTDAQWAKIPLTITEANFAQALAVNTPLIAPPQTGGLELITAIVVTVPPGATGVLKLGSFQLPLGPGTFSLVTALLLQASDVRQLTIAVAPGPAGLWVMGEQMPTAGTLSN